MDAGWVKVPGQFLALAVVAKAKNNQNTFEIARLLVRFDHVANAATFSPRALAESSARKT